MTTYPARDLMERIRNAHPLLAAGLVTLIGCGQVGDSASGAQNAADDSQCVPLETEPPNGRDLESEFESHTRACGVRSCLAFNVEVVARWLELPWADERLPDGSLPVTERPGRMSVVSADGPLGEPISGLPRVDARGQGGLHDVAQSPDFAGDRTIFWSYAEPRDGGNGTAAGRGALSEGQRSVPDRPLIC